MEGKYRIRKRALVNYDMATVKYVYTVEYSNDSSYWCAICYFDVIENAWTKERFNTLDEAKQKIDKLIERDKLREKVESIPDEIINYPEE